MLEKLVNESRSPRALAEAIMAPSSILVAGGAAAVLILAGAPLVLAAGAGVVAWGMKTLFGVRKVKVRKAVADPVDPFRVAEPWREYVQSALAAKSRFDRAVREAASGPLKTRLTEIGHRVEDGVQEVWKVARRAHALDNAVAELDLRGTQRELGQAEKDLDNASPDRRATLERTVAAVRSRMESGQRMAGVAQNAGDRLRNLDAQLEELVARGIELSVSTGDEVDLTGLRTDIEAVVGEMEALRQAMEETSGRPMPMPG